VRANTLQAHRLIHWAQQQGDARPLVERLFAAQFCHGENVGDPAVLLRAAVEAGYPAQAVRDYLATTENTEQVRALEREARQMGVNMIPTFRLDGRRLIVGAEDPSVLAAALLQAAA